MILIYSHHIDFNNCCISDTDLLLSYILFLNCSFNDRQHNDNKDYGKQLCYNNIMVINIMIIKLMAIN